MCGDGHGLPALAAVDDAAAEPFPWASGRVCDAHCHPTDTMASVGSIAGMGAAVLTVMATRSQDQELVAELAVEQGWTGSTIGDDADVNAPTSEGKVVPAFGWHPWFSYQLYDDTGGGGDGDGSRDLTSMDDKRRHLAAVLTPSPASAAGGSGHDNDDHNDNDDDAARTRDAFLSEALDVQAASMPAVRPLSAFVAETRARLLAHPAALVGEIGVDKAFRVPEVAASSAEPPSEGRPSQATPGGREGRRLSPFRVRPAHQVAVLAAQLRLAAELRRPVSVHGVQAHGQLYAALAATWRGHERDVLSRRERRQIAEGAEESSSSDDDEDPLRKKLPPPYPPTICLHSFSAPVEVLRQYLDPHIPAAVYFSFSTAVNAATDAARRRTAEVVAACPDDRLLVESDLHIAGAPMDAALEDMYRRVCAIKGWPLAEGIERVAHNYDAFLLRRRPPRQR